MNPIRYILLGCSLMLMGHQAGAQSKLVLKIDSLKTVLKTQANDTNRVNTLNLLGILLRNNGQLDAGLSCEQEAIALASTLGFEYGMTKALSHTGLIYSEKGNYTEALRYYKKALQLYEIRGDKNGMAAVLGNLGNLYRKQGNLPKALDYNLQALKLDEEMKALEGITARTGNIGLIYWNLGEFDNSLKYSLRALEMAEQLGNKRMKATAIGNIGNLYYDKGDLAMALNYYFMALKTDSVIGNKAGVARHLGNISVVYTDLANDCTHVNAKRELLQKAYDHALRSLKQEEENANLEGIAAAECNLGMIFLYMKKFNEAGRYLEHSLQLSKEVGSMEDIETAYEMLALLAQEKGDYRGALEHYKMYIVYRDSLVNEENTRKTVQSQMQFDFDKKMSADSIKNAEQVKQEQLRHEQEISQQKLYTYGGAAGFVLMLFVAGVSFRAFRQKQKDNAIITEQKLLVEVKQKEILDSIHYAKRIQRSLMPTEVYVERVLARLKNLN